MLNLQVFPLAQAAGLLKFALGGFLGPRAVPASPVGLNPLLELFFGQLCHFRTLPEVMFSIVAEWAVGLGITSMLSRALLPGSIFLFFGPVEEHDGPPSLSALLLCACFSFIPLAADCPSKSWHHVSYCSHCEKSSSV